MFGTKEARGMRDMYASSSGKVMMKEVSGKCAETSLRRKCWKFCLRVSVFSGSPERKADFPGK